MRKTVSGIIFAFLLISTFTLAFNVGLVHAQAPHTVYINSDGSVSPPSAPISTVDNATYTFTGNVSYPTYYGIVVERKNTVIDGNGYAVRGNQSGIGLDLASISNVTMENTSIEDFYYGVYLSSSNNITVSSTSVTENYYGIWLDSSSNNTVSRNTVSGNSGVSISLSYSSSNNVVSGNTATANSGPGIEIDFYSNNNIVLGNNATANGDNGIIIDYYSSNNVVSGNTATANSADGIAIESNNNIVIGNTATANSNQPYSGISVSGSNDTVSRNTATANFYGISLEYSSSNTVSDNDVTGSTEDGILLYDSSNNNVSGNDAAANGNGIHLFESSNNNAIYHNNFIGNANQTSVDSTSVGNAWDNGYPSGGNYWSDYQTKYPNAIGNVSSGIWNTPYVIDANNTDYYPLLNQVAVVPEFQPFLLLPLFMIITLLGAIAFKKKRNPKPRAGINKAIV